MLNYAFIFLTTCNIHLIKEVGMIPHYFNRLYNYKGTIITYQNGSYPFLQNYHLNLKLDFIKKGKQYKHFSSYCERNVLKYLIYNARKINILNLILPQEENELFGVLYKFLNRNGFLYLKMDIDESFMKNDRFYWYRDKIKHYTGIIDFIKFQFKKIINLLFYNQVDLISFESKELVNYFKRKYPKFKDKIIYIPNGIDDYYIKSAGIENLSFGNKENIILSVGRIGAEIKSNETLLEAISRIKDLKDWKVIFIGPIIKTFNKYLEDFFKKYPYLKEKIIFEGEISDRKKLYEFYQKSKIFCLTSLTESFGIVLVEAAIFGNYIVCSNFPSARDITMNEKFGKLFNPRDSNKLANILQYLINNQQLLKENSLKIQKISEENYYWSKIIQKLYQEMHKRRRK